MVVEQGLIRLVEIVHGLNLSRRRPQRPQRQKMVDGVVYEFLISILS